MSVSRIPSPLLAAIKTAQVGRLAEFAIFRGAKLGTVGEIAGLPGISALSAKPSFVAFWAKQALQFRGAFAAKNVSRSSIVFDESGEPEFTLKVMDDTTINRGSLGGADCMYGIALPDIPSVGNEGTWADAFGNTSGMATATREQTVTPGGSVASQQWTFSLYFRRVGAALPASASIFISLGDGTQLASKALSAVNGFANIAGWQRATVTQTFNGSPSVNTIRVGVSLLASAGAIYVYASAAQLELGGAATAYRVTQEGVVGGGNRLANSHFPCRAGWTSIGAGATVTLNQIADAGGRITAPVPGTTALSFANMGTALPDGTIEARPYDRYGQIADKAAVTSVASIPTVSQVATGFTPLNKSYVFSVFVRNLVTNGQPDVYLELQFQNSSSVTQQTITSPTFRLSERWRRLWIAGKCTASGCDRVLVLVRSATGNGTKDQELFGAMLEEEATGVLRVPARFFQTTTAIGGGNFLLRSCEFDNAAWTKTNVTITANTAYAPIVEVDLFHPDRGLLSPRPIIDSGSDPSFDFEWAESSFQAGDGMQASLWSIGAEDGTDLLGGDGDFDAWTGGVPNGWTRVQSKGAFTQNTTPPNYWPDEEDPSDVSSVKYVQTLSRGALEDYLEHSVAIPENGHYTLFVRFRGIERVRVQVVDNAGTSYLQGDQMTWGATATSIALPGLGGYFNAPVWGISVLHFWAAAGTIKVRIGQNPLGAFDGILETYFDQVRLYRRGGRLYGSTDRPETLNPTRTNAQGLCVLARGITEDQTGGDDPTFSLRVVGYLAGSDQKIPARLEVPECQWKFMGAPCGYVQTTTAAATRTGTLHQAVTVDHLEAGRYIVLPDNSSIRKILTVLPGTNEFTVDVACTMTTGDAIRYADCRRTFADCSYRNRMQSFGGFRGMSGVLSTATADLLNALHDPARQRRHYGAHATGPGRPLFGEISAQDLFDSHSIPIVYGRKSVALNPVERTVVLIDWPAADTAHTVGFYVIGEGPIDAVRALWSADGAVVHLGGGIQWWYWRRGDPGLATYFTEAEWIADNLTQLLTQEIDFRSNTGTAYSNTAHVILMTRGNLPGGTNDTGSGSMPELWADVRGLRVQAYNADGTVNGAPAWSQNPAWCVLDLLLNTRYGAGLPRDLIDWQSFITAAAICDVVINSTEAITVTAAAVAASKDVRVLSVAGFAPEMTVAIAGQADQAVDFVEITEQMLVLKNAVTISAGVAITGKPKQFTLNLAIDQPSKIADVLASMLLCCRGRFVYDGHKLAIKIDVALASETAHAYGSPTTNMQGIIPDSFKTDRRSWRNTPNVLEAVYSRGGAARPEAALYRLVDAAAGGGDFPRPLRLEIPGCETGDQAARCAIPRFARVTASGALSEGNRAEGYRIQTGLAGLVPQLGDRITAGRLRMGTQSPRTTEGRLAGKEIDPKLAVTLKVAPERSTMRLDPFGPTFDVYTGDVPRRQEAGEPHARPTITISIVRNAGRSLLVLVTKSGFRYTPVPIGSGGRVSRPHGQYELHCSTSAGFTPGTGTSGAGATLVSAVPATRNSILWEVPDSLVEQVLYLKVVAVAVRPAGPLVSNEVSTTVYRVDRGETDPTQTVGASPLNMVYEGDFVSTNGTGGVIGDANGQDNSIGWRHNATTTQTDRDPSGHTTPSGIAWPGQDSAAAFASPANAYDNTAAVATGAAIWQAAADGGPNATYATILFSFAAGTRTGRGKVKCRNATTPGDSGSLLLYYRTVTAGAWTLFATVTSTSLGTYKAPTVIGQDMSQFQIAAVGKATQGVASHDNHVAVDEVDFEEDTAGTGINVTIANRILTLNGDATNYAQAWHRFPGKNPPDSGTWFSAGTLATCRLQLRRTVAGSAPTHPVEVVLYDALTATEYLLIQVATGDIASAWQDFAAQLSVGAAIVGKLYVIVRSKSTNSVDCKQLLVAPGEMLHAWIPSDEERANGVWGDFSHGRAIAFGRGAWVAGPTTYKKSAVA